jgi:hypothetical protein
MTSTTSPAPHFEAAGMLLDALAAHDFAALGEALDGAATMCCLLPRGYREMDGPDEITAAFRTWFGDVDRFEVVDASVGQIGDLLELRWRLRVEGGRFEDEVKVVEQHAYATLGDSGRIDHLRLLCSGFWDEHAPA